MHRSTVAAHPFQPPRPAHQPGVLAAALAALALFARIAAAVARVTP